jgi:hypothetical protein
VGCSPRLGLGPEKGRGCPGWELGGSGRRELASGEAEARTLEWRRRKRLGASVCGGDSRRRNSVVAALTAPQRTRETARRLRQRARGARRGSVL